VHTPLCALVRKEVKPKPKFGIPIWLVTVSLIRVC